MKISSRAYPSRVNPITTITIAMPGATIHHYRRPSMANSPAAATDDMHRRFLLESTSNVRNLSLNLYNRGER